MAFTKAYAKILAGMLSGDDLEAFRFICGKSEKNNAHCSPEVIDNLIALELVRREIVDGGIQMALLTSRGKKVREYV
jgi:hypothetical protein